MKMNMMRLVGVLAVVVVVAGAGCRQEGGAAGVGERTGAALDRAADKTVDAAGAVVEKTGEVLEKAGSAVENTGANM